MAAFFVAATLVDRWISPSHIVVLRLILYCLKQTQRRSVMTYMVFHESGNKPVAVVVTRLPAQKQFLPRFGAGLIEQFRFQLAFQKLIGLTLIDQDRARKGLLSHQLAGIVLRPA